MGGRAFSKGVSALYTPRMTPPIYRHIYSHLSTSLGSLFPRVTNYIEGPEKSSFGDVDLGVNLEGSVFSQEQKKDPARTDIWTAVSKALGPVRTHHDCRRVINVKSFAVPWPKDFSPAELAPQLALEAAELQAQEKAKAASKMSDLIQNLSDAAAVDTSHGNAALQGSPTLDRDARFVHVDIRLCDSTRDLEWHMFKNAHGYLWTFLGSSMQPFGLLIDNDGLQLNVHHHANVGNKKARIFLSNDPIAVLDFLGLSHANGEWTRPFQSHAELLQYISTWRWFSPRPINIKKPQTGPSILKVWRSYPGVANAFYESRMASGKQPVQRKKVSLKDVRRAVFSTFPGSEHAYAEEIARWKLEEKAQIWGRPIIRMIDRDACIPTNITHVLPESATNRPDIEEAWRRVLRAALKRLILKRKPQDDDEYKFDSIEIPNFDSSRNNLEEVAAWIQSNWEAVGQEAWGRVTKAMEKMNASGADISVGSPTEVAQQVWGKDLKSKREEMREKTQEVQYLIQKMRETIPEMQETGVKSLEKNLEMMREAIQKRNMGEIGEKMQESLGVNKPSMQDLKTLGKNLEIIQKLLAGRNREETGEALLEKQQTTEHSSSVREPPPGNTPGEASENAGGLPPGFGRGPWVNRKLLHKEAADEAAPQDGPAQTDARLQDK